MAEDAAKVGEDRGANERSTEGSSTLIAQASVFVYFSVLDRVRVQLVCERQPVAIGDGTANLLYAWSASSHYTGVAWEATYLIFHSPEFVFTIIACIELTIVLTIVVNR